MWYFIPQMKRVKHTPDKISFDWWVCLREGPRPTEFMAQLDRICWNSKPSPGWIGHATTSDGYQSDLVSGQGWHFTPCWKGFPLLYIKKWVHVFPDFTPTVARRRANFIKVKKELHSCANVKFGFWYLATLHITMSSSLTHRFEDLDQALEFVNKRLQSLRETDQRHRAWWSHNKKIYLSYHG